MTEQTIGARIAVYRKEKGMTQEELAERMNVSPQAVSKWENDVSCPDILLLPALARELGVTTDVLLSGETAPAARLLPEEKKRDLSKRLLKIELFSEDKEQLLINLPMPLAKLALRSGKAAGLVSGHGAEALKDLDPAQLMELVEQGVVGELVKLVNPDGSGLRIVVE